MRAQDSEGFSPVAAPCAMLRLLQRQPTVAAWPSVTVAVVTVGTVTVGSRHPSAFKLTSRAASLSGCLTQTEYTLTH